MNIVAMDTSGTTASVAVMKDDVIAYAGILNQGLTHSETVMPALDEAMRAAGLKCDQVDAFAAVAGPGSFTGVRIGVCAVKGLAHAVDRPCARIDSLDALAMNFYGFDGIICPILDARRGQVYTCLSDGREGMPRRLSEDMAIALEDLMAKLPADRRVVFLGDGVSVHQRKILDIRPDAVIAPQSLMYLRAEAACVLAAAKPEEWMKGHQLTPIYLRPPQAERERDRRLRKGI